MNYKEFSIRLLLIIIPIFLSVALTAFLILLLGQNPGEVFESALKGAFGDPRKVSSTVNFWVPLTLVSTGLIITFTAGLWNIGVEGQIMMGAIFASAVAQYWSLPSPLLIFCSVLAAGIGGMLWGVLIGVLKVRFGVHEIFGGVALNAIANTFAIYLISGPWQPPEGGSAQSTPPFPDGSWLPPISADIQVNGFILLLAILSIGLVYYLLKRTRLGLEFKATGKNPRSALLLGISTGKVSILAFVLCGLLAGIAGSYRVLYTYHSLRPLVSGGIGFLGLLVVLLISYNLILVPLVTFIFAAGLNGSASIKIKFQLDQSLVGVLQGLIVLLILLFNGIRERILKPKSLSADPSEPLNVSQSETLT
ncbi:ABC transporter permease [Anaerolineales bacterium]